MTVADQPSSRAIRPAVAVLRPSIIPPPQFPLPPQAARSWLTLFATGAAKRTTESAQKPLADVVDLLVMETLDHPASTAPSLTPPPPASAGATGGRGGADPLDSLVQDHLKRSTHPMDGAAKQISTRAINISTPPPADEQALSMDLLQREIDALLAGEPSPTAPLEPAAQAVAVETASFDHASSDPAALNQAELNVLLEQPAVILPPPNEPVPPPPLTMPEEDEAASKMLEAEGVLAEELAQLMAETAAVADKETPVEVSPSSPALESTAAVEAQQVPQPPEGVPEYPIVELAGEIEGDFESEAAPPRGHRWAGLMNDIALVTAQIADMPFRWIDLMDKNLLGVAAAVLLLSGIALKVAAWWMGV